MAGVIPQCLALVPCEAVLTDESGRRLTVVGAFHSFEVERLPAVAERFVVWAQVTDCNGAMELGIALERVPKDTPEVELIWHAGRQLPAGDPRVIHDYRVPVPHFVLTHDGEYRIALMANNRTLVQRYFVVERAP